MTEIGITMVAVATAFAATPLVRRLAALVGATDAPGGRRIHERRTPRGGGLAVLAGAAAGCAVASVPLNVDPGMVAGLAVVLLAGVADDVVGLRPQTKLAAQVLAAVLATAGGLRLVRFAAPYSAGPEFFLTVLWIVFVINAFNLADGLDGLATGMGLIVLAWFVALRTEVSAVTAAVGGGLLGFLPYNVHPATIFLGDAGSLLVGYAVAVLPLMAREDHVLPCVALFLLVAVPLTDLLLTVARRFCARCFGPWGEGRFWHGVIEGLRNTVRPDRRHIHHRLLDLGLAQPRAVLVLYAAAIATGGLGLLVAHARSRPFDLVALGTGMTVIAIVRALGFEELRPARSGLLLPIARRLARRRGLVLVTDLLFAAAAYGVALLLVGNHGDATPRQIAAALAVMGIAQVAALAAGGAYRTVWQASGVDEVVLLLQASLAATVGGYIVCRLLALPSGGGMALVHLTLVTLAVAVLRLSPALLARAVRRAGAERVLICGTTPEGCHAVGRLRRNGAAAPLTPIGFVEVQPRWQRAHVQRLPVLGTLEALGELIGEHGVRHLVIADSRLHGPALDWVRAVCRHGGVRLYHYSEPLVPDKPAAPAVAEVARTG